jgi:serine phosphatase RsbU (regulator of sigma subunit)
MAKSRATGNTNVIQQAFKGLDQEAVDMLKKFAVKKSFSASTVICREGELANAMYVITNGRVVFTRNMGEDNEDFMLGMKGSGGFFGEIALITQETRAATVTALVDTEVLEITKEQFDEVFAASPAMARSILLTMIQTVRETDKRALEDLESRNTELAQAYTELEAAQDDKIARAALEAQLDVAARAQRSLLPTELPVVPGFQFAAQFEPAKQVGGDFYDVRLLPDGSISVLVADVSDKGAHAALFMAVARTLFLTEQAYQKDPVDVAMAVHRGLLNASNYDMFVTALYGVIDPETRIFRYVRAGHDEPLYARPNGDITFLGGKGRFLGLWPDFSPVFEEQQLQLEAGDTLVIYSDGVTDMRNPEGETFTRERLREMVKSIRMYDAERIAKSIYNGVQQHRNFADAFDDFTLVVVKTV